MTQSIDSNTLRKMFRPRFDQWVANGTIRRITQVWQSRTLLLGLLTPYLLSPLVVRVGVGRVRGDVGLAAGMFGGPVLL